MSWQWILVAFGFGLFCGYLLCDVLTTESKITYVIKKLRAKDQGVISVDSEATLSRREKRNQRREARKNK